MRAPHLALLSLVGLAACGDGGTYAVLHFENGPAGVNVINATLTLATDPTPQPATYNAGAGAAFTFPQTAVIQFVTESGALTVDAEARDSANNLVAKATGKGTVQRGKTIDVEIDFAAMMPPDMTTPPGTLVVSPTLFDFGAANIGQTGVAKRFTVTNNGTLASGNITVTKSGDMSDFTVASPADCATRSLDPGGSCTVDVQFTPMTPLVKNAQLVITADGPGGVATAALTGKGVAKGNLAFNEDAHTFPDTLLDSASADVTFTLKNSALAASANVTVSLVGTDKDQFEIANDHCTGNSVMGMGTCDVTVHAKPTAREVVTATLEADAGMDTALVTLTGKGLAPAHLKIDKPYTMASPFDLGQVEVGATGDGTGLSNLYTFMVTNDGDVAAGELNVALVPSMGAEINALMPQTTCSAAMTGGGSGPPPTVLNPGDSCAVVLALQPQTFGIKNVEIDLSATPGGMVSTFVKGVGHDQVVLQLHNDTTTGGTGSIHDSVNNLNCPFDNSGTQCAKTFDRTDQNMAPHVSLGIMNLGPNSMLEKWATTPTGLPCDGNSVTPCQVTFDTSYAAGTYDITAIYSKSTYHVNVQRTDANFTGAVGSLGSLTFSDAAFATCGSGCQTNADETPNTQIVITASGLGPGGLPNGDFPLRGIRITTASGNVPVYCNEGNKRTALDANPLVCTVTVNADLQVNVTYSAHNYAFVSSQTYDGNLGGLGGADSKCQSLADAVSLPGTFKAVLSDSNNDVSARLPAKRGWVRVDAKPFCNARDELFGNAPSNNYRMYLPLVFDETGAQHNNLTDKYRTASNGQGLRTSVSCSDWTNNANVGATVVWGTAGAVSEPWINYNSDGTNCATKYGLICMGTDNDEPIPPPPPMGGARRIFVSAVNVAGGFPLTTRANMDIECQNEGSAAFPGGMFRAYVATTASSAQSQANITSTWTRPDNFIVGDQTALFGNGPLATGINQHADGSYIGVITNVWTGAATPGAAAANGNADSCIDWTAETGGGGTSGRASIAGAAASGYFDIGPAHGCGQGNPFYCIQYGP
jgi:hypothetical protein